MLVARPPRDAALALSPAQKLLGHLEFNGVEAHETALWHKQAALIAHVGEALSPDVCKVFLDGLKAALELFKLFMHQAVTLHFFRYQGLDFPEFLHNLVYGRH